MKKKLVFFCYMLVFSFPLFCEKALVFFGAEGMTLFSDDSGTAFEYGADCAIRPVLEKPVFEKPVITFSSSYKRGCSTQKNIFGFGHGASFSSRINFSRTDFSFAFFAGSIPEKITFCAKKFSFTQNEISFYNASAAFSYSFADSLSLGSGASFFSENTGYGSVLGTDASVSFPCLVFGNVYANLPFGIYVAGTGVYTELSATLNKSSVAGGSGSGFGALFQKTFAVGKNSRSFLDTLVFYASGKFSASGTALGTQVNVPFFPFSYMHGELLARLHALGAGAACRFSFGDFNASVFALYALCANASADIFYKYTYQDTIFYDGSSHKDFLSFGSAREDSALAFGIKANYTFYFTGAHGAACIEKYGAVPFLSEKSKANFKNLYEGEEKDSAAIAKMILLSGVRVCVRLYL